MPDAHGCFVSGDSMEPAYERGNVLLVSPSVSPSRATTWSSYVKTKDGTRYVLKQYNPAKTFTLPSKEWSKAHLVIGKYNKAG